MRIFLPVPTCLLLVLSTPVAWAEERLPEHFPSAIATPMFQWSYSCPDSRGSHCFVNGLLPNGVYQDGGVIHATVVLADMRIGDKDMPAYFYSVAYRRAFEKPSTMVSTSEGMVQDAGKFEFQFTGMTMAFAGKPDIPKAEAHR